jgi:hypothetical protein
MDVLKYLKDSENFEGGDSFPTLLKDGLEIIQFSHQDFAKKMEVIPSTVSRWVAGATRPLVGMQIASIQAIRKVIYRILRGELVG